MPNKGDSYTIELKRSHLQWGTHRYTNSRDRIYGEGYIPIPSTVAQNLQILNSNGTNGVDVLGQNLFNCSSREGFFQGILKAQGTSSSGNIYAKQFSALGNLKQLGNWYKLIDAKIGDRIQVSWTSAVDIIIEKL